MNWELLWFGAAEGMLLTTLGVVAGYVLCLRHQEYKRSRPHDGLIDGSGVQSGTDAQINPERETE